MSVTAKDFINHRYAKPGSTEKIYPEVTRAQARKEHEDMVRNVLEKELYKVFQAGEKAFTLHDLDRRCSAPMGEVSAFLQVLIEGGEIEEVSGTVTRYRRVKGDD